MANEQLNSLESSTTNVDEEINLLDYLVIINKYRRMIISLCTAAVIISTIVSLLLPNIYRATTTIMPSQKDGSMSTLAAKLGGLSNLTGGLLLGGTNPNDLYIDILRSRTITDRIIERFKLAQMYEITTMPLVRKKLRDNLILKTSKANVLSISIEDKNPEQAAKIANAYVEELDKLSRRINLSDATRQRSFLEHRLKEAKERLNNAERDLKEFQEKNKIVSLEAQAQATILAAAQIKGNILATETELKMLRGFVSGDENQVIRLQQKLVELKNQLAKIETVAWSENNPNKPKGLSHGKLKEESNFYLTFNQIPSLGLKFARLMREVKIQETVFELLTQQYEMSRIAEAKDTSNIQVLDKAITPEKKSKPQRGLLVVLSGIFALVISILLSFLLESVKRTKLDNKNHWKETTAQP